MIQTSYYRAPFGWLALSASSDALVALTLNASPESSGLAGREVQQHPILGLAHQQLQEYFLGERQQFEIPLLLEGTTFQQQCWHALLNIGFGQTCSYKQIAESIDNPKAVRAVGMANNRNKLAIIVPCHRVIGSQGQLVGYGGGLSIKSWLLEHEKRIVALQS